MASRTTIDNRDPWQWVNICRRIQSQSNDQVAPWGNLVITLWLNGIDTYKLRTCGGAKIWKKTRKRSTRRQPPPLNLCSMGPESTMETRNEPTKDDLWENLERDRQLWRNILRNAKPKKLVFWRVGGSYVGIFWPSGPRTRFWSIFDRFLFDFWSIFYHFLIDFGMTFGRLCP